MAIRPVMLVISKLLMFFSQISFATDTITQFQSFPDGSTLVSKDGSFELGFFSPGSSTNRYVGIWYNNIPVRTVVWVANRDNPIKDNSSMLIISREGNLVLLGKNQTLLWSTTTTGSLSLIVQLLDTGNLVLRDLKDNNNEESILWQSFDHPSDTLLPGMKLGWDLKTGLNRKLTAWKNWDDPSPRNFTWGIVLSSNPEMVLWKGSVEYHRSGLWNGVGFSGAPALKVNPIVDTKFVNNADEVYYTYSLKNKSVISITFLNQTPYLRQRVTWIPENRSWRLYESVPRDSCDAYDPCGPYGNCIVNESPICQCLKGFKPNSPQNWDTMVWTQGCVRSEPWSCGVKNRDGFLRFAGLKLSDTTHSWVNGSMTLEDCKAKCLENCTCMAYSTVNVTGAGSGCSIWFGGLIDLKLVSASGQDLYIRMGASETDAKHGHKRKVALVIIITLLLLLVFLFALFYIYKSRRKHRVMKDKIENTMSTEEKDEDGQQDFELPFFDLATIVNAINDFSNDNKLGEGGFRPVYKDTLADGQEIAIKRLSRSSRQGLNEFKNEVILCAKLHRNLVKVLGCYIQGEEKMLLYEYMPNKSLDSFLFDSAQSKLLDWSKRFHILCAIAQGLLYLHQDSRLRIIHRDLKASNILLDNDMNPKISDFGLARMCRGDQIEGSTNKVVGTYGYMAPEYAIDGLFSIKSDVFSFGILLLRIISGKKSKGLTYPSYSHNLIGHAWRLWKEGKPNELIDDCLRDSCILSEALRCIQIGLLCIQHHPDDRPNMASVIVMLTNESALAQPKEPGFLIQKVSIEGESSHGKGTSTSINEVTISLLDASFMGATKHGTSIRTRDAFSMLEMLLCFGVGPSVALLRFL